MRTSASQFQILVEYMERNGDLSKPTEGPQGRAANVNRWAELCDVINADATGDTKTVEKWRKVWSDLKNNTKKKSARIHRAAQGTGGGPATNLKLTDLELRVLSIIGTQAATGIIEIAEVGLEEDVTEVTMAPHTMALAPDVMSNDSPSIFIINEQIAQQTCSGVEAWNRPGTSAQPSFFPPLPSEPAAAPATRQHSPQSPTPLPPTPRRRRRRQAQARSSPGIRRTRTQTQSDLARQAFVRSDSEWRLFQQEAERERNRLRELEIRNQERWLELFIQFLALGNRIVDVVQNKYYFFLYLFCTTSRILFPKAKKWLNNFHHRSCFLVRCTNFNICFAIVNQ